MIWFLIGYILCAFLSYGMLFAYVQGNFPMIAEQQYSEDMGTSILFGLFSGMLGPIGVIISFLMTGFAKHGFKVK